MSMAFLRGITGPFHTLALAIPECPSLSFLLTRIPSWQVPFKRPYDSQPLTTNPHH